MNHKLFKMKKTISHIYHFSGSKDGPSVVIMGAVHGNERIGVDIIEALKKLLEKVEIFGEIYLIIANPKAYEKNLRFIDCDLNRLFSNNFEQIKKKKKKELMIEEKRAIEIAPILSKADYLLDIHSTIKKSIPFVYVENSKSHLKLAKVFRAKYIISSLDSCQAKSLHSSADNFVDKHNGLGITYETGWQKDYAVFPHVLKKTKIFLKSVASSFLDFPVEDKKEKDHSEQIFIYKEIIPQKENFTFSMDYQNFDFLKKGEILAREGEDKIIIEKDSYIIFPKINIHLGKTACYLASKNL